MIMESKSLQGLESKAVVCQYIGFIGNLLCFYEKIHISAEICQNLVWIINSMIFIDIYTYMYLLVNFVYYTFCWAKVLSL